MIKRNFPQASNQGDWTMPVAVSIGHLTTVMTDDELVEFHLAPDDNVTWDDYGLQRTGAPTYRAGWHTFEANSNDGTGVVQIAPGTTNVAVIVPAHVMRTMGPAMCSLGMHFTRLSTGQRVTLLTGRLPIVSVA